MKLYIAVLCIVLIQGVHVNCQSSYIDSAVSTINSVYQQYRSGTLLRNLLQTAREYLNSAVIRLNQLQNLISSFQVPKLPPVTPPTVPARIWQQWAGR